MSGKYISHLPSNPWVDVAGDITTKTGGIAYQLGNPPPMASVTYDIAFTVIGAAVTGIKTIDIIGTSIEIMDPPIYLRNNLKFTALQKMLGMPITGTWEGSGFYHVQGGHVYYQETLKTEGKFFAEIADRFVTVLKQNYDEVNRCT